MGFEALVRIPRGPWVQVGRGAIIQKKLGILEPVVKKMLVSVPSILLSLKSCLLMVRLKLIFDDLSNKKRQGGLKKVFTDLKPAKQENYISMLYFI